MNNLVPIVMFAGFFAMVFGIAYLRTRQNLAMIEKGMNPKQFANRPVPYLNLKWGLLLIGAGLGLLIAYIADLSVAVIDGEENPTLYFALIAIFGGIGLIASYKIEKKELLDRETAS
jgi:membrane protease YdiL (CAAX protease family)